MKSRESIQKPKNKAISKQTMTIFAETKWRCLSIQIVIKHRLTHAKASFVIHN